MTRKVRISGELSLVMGLVLISIAISLMVQAGFGISTISSLPYVLSEISHTVTFGVWNLFFQICLLIILVSITKRFKPGYLLSFIIAAGFGVMLDLFTGLLSGLPSGIFLCSLYFVAGYPIMCIGISLMVGSGVPLMIADMFIIDLNRFYRITFRRMKTIFDIVCMASSVALSLIFLGGLVGVGVGTVILALITGSGVQATNKAIGKVLIIVPWSGTLEKMAA